MVSCVCAVQKLLEAGVDPCTADDKKRTALHYAVCRGNPALARLLLEKGADPNQRDILGNTPLHLAACTSHIELITLLLRAGTDVTAVDHSGRSPLQLALSKLRLLRAEMARTSAHVKSEVIQVLLNIPDLSIYSPKSL
ncbi:ANKRD54 [Cordylochernes scorpioides]|uniref:ANKRD54 n=1 Tax=Cordylochernes scorpioides TaxID=51811 RepID=A0ABY6K535_9ARAC|nr:ANKRD54 [Cordylochernes scorpioides]